MRTLPDSTDALRARQLASSVPGTDSDTEGG
jgi:hypothetical protein